MLRVERETKVLRVSGPSSSIEDPQEVAERDALKTFREERPPIERHQSDFVISEFRYYDRDARRWTFDVTVTRLSRVLDKRGRVAHDVC